MCAIAAPAGLRYGKLYLSPQCNLMDGMIELHSELAALCDRADEAAENLSRRWLSGD